MSRPSAPIVNVVLGTAGHIDHGKTALIKQLTGIDADRFREEKERGMTIDIGYAHMLLDRRLDLGVIDVPGHERFVRNMVAGATGFGLVLLVVAADDGVMPQTREHVEIMQILGIRRGICVITKIDIVDAEMVELVEEDVRDFMTGTFLKDAPLYKVSSQTGEGIPALRRAVEEAIDRIAVLPPQGVFRLPVQRSFSARGQGTVITGVAVSGTVDTGSHVEIQPGGLEVRVKAMEAYGQTIERARAGHRTALNLVGVDYRSIARGHVITEPGYLTSAPFVTARFQHLRSARRPLRNQTAVRFHSGTFDALGRIFLLGRKALDPGEEDFVQIRLETVAPVAPGDRYIVRLPSPASTIGGGIVLETGTKRIKPNRSWVLEGLAAREKALATPVEFVAHILGETGLTPLGPTELARRALIPLAELNDLLSKNRDLFVPVYRQEKVLRRDLYDKAKAKVLVDIEEYHRCHPLRLGQEKVALRDSAQMERRLFDEILAFLVSQDLVQFHGSLFSLPGFTPVLDEAARQALQTLEEAFDEGGFSPPDPAEALAALPDPASGKEILRHLKEKGDLVEVGPGLLFHTKTLARAEAYIREEITRNGELVSADFRDHVGTTRKFAIPLLEYFDTAGLTLRLDNIRVLREHGGRKPPKGPS